MTKQSHCWAYTGNQGNQNWKRHMYPNVHCSTVYNSWDMETTKMSIGRRMDKKVGVQIHNGSIQFSTVAQSCPTLATPWTAAHQAYLSVTNSQSLLKLMSFESVMPFNHLILCRPLAPPAFNLSQHQGLFQWVSSLHQVAKVLEFQLSISPSNEYSGMMSFRIDWFDLLAV